MRKVWLANNGSFIKGHVGWNKGEKLSKKHRERISKGNSGKIRTEEMRKRISESRKGLLKGVENPKFRHGMCRTRFYGIWTDMNTRCSNTKNSHYGRYGGRGIKVLWKSFVDFKDDMLDSYQEHVERFTEKNTTIDRINNDGNYHRGNCRWATRQLQAKNKSQRRRQ